MGIITELFTSDEDRAEVILALAKGINQLNEGSFVVYLEEALKDIEDEKRKKETRKYAG